MVGAGGAAAHENPGQHPESLRAAWSIVAVLVLMAAVSYLDRQTISLMATMVKHDLKINDIQIGILLGPAFAVSYALAGLPIAHIADRWPRRNIIYFGVTFWSVAATLCGFARSFDALLIGRIGVGIGEAALLPTAYSIISDIFPKHKITLVISVLAVGVLAGSAAALAAAGLVLDWAADGITIPVFGKMDAWQAAFVVTGLPGLIVAFLIYTQPEPARSKSGFGERDKAGWRDMLGFMYRNRRLYICHFGGFSSIYLLTAANLGWIPSHVERAFGWSHLRIGLMLSTNMLVGGVVALLAMGKIVDWMIERGINDAHLRFYMLLTPAIAAFAALAYSASSAVVFFTFLTPLLMLLCMSGVAASALQLITPSRFRARVSAIYLFIIALLGMSLGPTIIGVLTDRLFGNQHMLWASLLLTNLIFAPIAGILFWLGMKPMREILSNPTRLA